jgi:hypothetical protein
MICNPDKCTDNRLATKRRESDWRRSCSTAELEHHKQGDSGAWAARLGLLQHFGGSNAGMLWFGGSCPWTCSFVGTRYDAEYLLAPAQVAMGVA